MCFGPPVTRDQGDLLGQHVSDHLLPQDPGPPHPDPCNSKNFFTSVLGLTHLCCPQERGRGWRGRYRVHQDCLPCCSAEMENGIQHDSGSELSRPAKHSLKASRPSLIQTVKVLTVVAF